MEEQYNVRLRHPDRERFHAAARHASALTYGRLACRRNLRYLDGGRTLLDFFPAAVNEALGGARPAVAFFHGGYWQAHERHEFAFVANAFVAAGIGTALVGYDLAPAVPIDTIIAQARCACAWLRAHADELGFDAGQLFTAGHSAGAHLAATCLSAEGAIRGAVLVSGIYDLDPLRPTSLNRPLGLDAPAPRRASPMFQIFPPRADLLLVVGADETREFVRQTLAFAAAWRDAERTAEVLLLPAAHHYNVLFGLADPASALGRRAVRHVARALRAPA